MSRGFRVWDKKRSRYVGDGEIVFKSYGNEASVVVCPNSQDYIGDICHDEYTDDGRFVVEQDTGLKDKNGEMICEGDIVNTCCGKAKVYFDEEYCSYKIWLKHGTTMPLVGKKSHRHLGYEVISNIHDNPEF